MYLQHGTIDPSFSEIIIDSGVRSAKLFVFQNAQYFIYSTNTQVKISNMDASVIYTIYSGDTLIIDDVFVGQETVDFCGYNLDTNQGFVSFSSYNESQTFISAIPNYNHKRYLKIISNIAYLIVDSNDQLKLIQNPNGSPINSGNPLSITNINLDRIYKDSFYDQVNDKLFIYIETFNNIQNLLQLESIVVESITTNINLQSPHIISDLSKNIIYMDTYTKNSTNYVIVLTQSTISPTENQSQNNFTFSLPDNTIQIISLNNYSIYKSFTLSNVFVDNITPIQDVSGRITFVGYGFENSGLPLKYLSIPLDSSDNIDPSVDGKGYHFEQSQLNGYYLLPNGKVEGSKEYNTNNIYILTEAMTDVDQYGISLISTKLSYPYNIQEIFTTMSDFSVIDVIDDYGNETQVVLRKPDQNGNIEISGITGSSINTLTYTNIPQNLVILFSNSPFSHVVGGQTQIGSFYVKYYYDTGSLYNFNDGSLSASIQLSPNHNYSSLTWYDKNPTTQNYQTIDTATPEADGITFIFTITQNGGTVISGILNNGGGGSIGSDPHVTTLFGKKYDMKHPSSRHWYTIFKKNNLNIEGHFTGLKQGIFFDNVRIKNKDELVTIDFNKKTIKNKSSYLIQDKTVIGDLKYENLTSNKNFGKVFEPSTMTKIHIPDEKTPLNLYVDFKTRYLHFRFPNNVPKEEECSGLLVRKEC